jgi:ribosomal protein RSM22 (predicted rRNA methylase)
MLRSDARRLFSQDTSPNDNTGNRKKAETWQTEYQLKKYKSVEQAGRHGVRDGTAFASVALPAHYSAIYSVLDHVKRRLERGWNVERIIDWGTGTGSGLW